MTAEGSLDFNEQFQQAVGLIDTGMRAFITRKAGVGKSTLPRCFLAVSDRREVVVAPTGFAAPTVGGQTIHRLFRFPTLVIAEFSREALQA